VHHPLTIDSASTIPTSSGSTWLDHEALRRIRGSVSSAPIRFALWDGFTLAPDAGTPVGTIRFKNRSALFGWIWDPDLNFGEGYMSGAVEISGDLVALLESIYRILSATPTRPWWRAWQEHIDLQAAKANVHHHYDLGNAFYRLWLDREMVYTCAYFPTPEATLEQAQIAKMDLICRKLDLEPGEHVIEAGCGWGSLALFMAKRYGVTVQAFNLSIEQIEYARARAASMGLADRVEFVEDDYRNAVDGCDAFVSVGMLEHVGLQDYTTLGHVIGRTLAGHGRGLLHFIGRNQPAPLNPWIRRRIFPGAYPPTLREVFERVLEPQGLSVLDVENLRLHYSLTLAHWLSRFEDASTQITTMFGKTFVRAWRLYLAGSQAAFTTGSMQLFQVLFSPSGNNSLPWVRVGGL
jgi:cyclopropane-fatty-acyl-phospholipid synthase